MVFVTGDTHGDWKSRLNRYVFPEGVELTKDDYVIVCGDFGIWDDSPREHANLDWLENKKFTTLFVAGNHSNYDILDNLPVEEWHGGKVNFIRPSVIHLMRGQIFDINDRSFFTFGGASCHDIPDGVLEPDDERIESWYKMRKMFRINHLSWWSFLPRRRWRRGLRISPLTIIRWTISLLIVHVPLFWSRWMDIRISMQRIISQIIWMRSKIPQSLKRGCLDICMSMSALKKKNVTAFLMRLAD